MRRDDLRISLLRWAPRMGPFQRRRSETTEYGINKVLQRNGTLVPPRGFMMMSMLLTNFHEISDQNSDRRFIPCTFPQHISGPLCYRNTVCTVCKAQASIPAQVRLSVSYIFARANKSSLVGVKYMRYCTIPF